VAGLLAQAVVVQEHLLGVLARLIQAEAEAETKVQLVATVGQA
jgi:hypothetical protein